MDWQELGRMDIYLIDQLMKGNINKEMKILDAGCGAGRNLEYFIRNNYKAWGVDANAEVIEALRENAKYWNEAYDVNRFSVADLGDLSKKKAEFDLVICNAVLHFAKDKAHFETQLANLWRVLKPGGLLFSRLTSDIGVKDLVKPMGNGRYLLPDESERYLVSHHYLIEKTAALGGQLAEFIKTTNVHNLRAMTTWVVRKVVTKSD